MKIYFAGPLFTWGERTQNALIVSHLRAAGYDVFLPQESEQKSGTARGIFESDIKGLDGCDAVVACMDGPDPDSGTCFEVGQVWRRKPIILYRTDIREEKPPLGPYNLMLHVAASAVLSCQWMEPASIAAEIIDKLDKITLS